ncbi:MAG TPA: 23S rRNA (pseudouridine(1915)-N(3))-methyltransferase RlmH [Bacteroidales bacterium]|nr:23S rRNA (pseudouridine(1915)-N(3))-methyltransferase RlmH [Bacteroidales bacterium]
MKIRMMVIGETDLPYVKQGLGDYVARIKKYVPFAVTEVPALRNTAGLSREEWKKREAEQLRKHFSPGEYLVLLDEKGREMTSREFAAFLGQRFNQGLKTLVFLEGGPFGASDALAQQADFRLSLSRMTFPHQLFRLIFCEQLYRALTLLRNEPYHHD